MATVLITGCSTGFGRMAAEELAARGDRVFATMRDTRGRNRVAAEELRARAGIEGWALDVLELDGTSDASVEAAAAGALGSTDTIDVVINNAGQMFVGFSEAYSADQFQQQLDVNLVGVHRVTRAFLPIMRRAGSGLFINISSIAGRIGAPFFGIYHGSKWGLEGYSLGLRREIACTGVDVVVVEPGPFTTELFPRSVAPDDADGRIDGYPEVAHDTLKALGVAFEEMFADPAMPTDPELVVARLIELIDMEPGARPFRSVVGVDLGVADRNASSEAHEAPFLEMMGFTDFVSLAPGQVPS